MNSGAAVEEVRQTNVTAPLVALGAKGEPPKRLRDWQRMFSRIYPPTQTGEYGAAFARLTEELGELAEAVLVDATYQPVDKLAKHADQDRDEVIANDYPLLIEDLLGLMPDRSVPVVLIKANVCRKLEPLLSKDGFTVLNGGCPIYFPSNGRQMDFKKQFAAIVARIQLPTIGQKPVP